MYDNKFKNNRDPWQRHRDSRRNTFPYKSKVLRQKCLWKLHRWRAYKSPWNRHDCGSQPFAWIFDSVLRCHRAAPTLQTQTHTTATHAEHLYTHTHYIHRVTNAGLQCVARHTHAITYTHTRILGNTHTHVQSGGAALLVRIIVVLASIFFVWQFFIHGVAILTHSMFIYESGFRCLSWNKASYRRCTNFKYFINCTSKLLVSWILFNHIA